MRIISKKKLLKLVANENYLGFLWFSAHSHVREALTAARWISDTRLVEQTFTLHRRNVRTCRVPRGTFDLQ